VLEPALLDRAQIPGDLVHGPRDPAPLEVVDLVATALQHRVVAVVEVNDVARVGDHRGRVGADQVLAILADAEQSGLPLRATTILFGVARGDHRDAVGALHLEQRRRDRILEGRGAVLEGVIDQMDDGLGVGLGAELVAQLGELGLQRARVLDDPV